jgi:hypothetical protein
MKYPVRKFKNLSIALKELEPFVRNGQHLQTGKPFSRFGGMRSREILANWLLCAAMNSLENSDFYFTTDPTGGDGMICDAHSDDTWIMEHVMVPNLAAPETHSLEERILQRITQKITKGGAAYATGKTLLVFLNAGGDDRWWPNRIARNLPSPLHFDTIWIVGLLEVSNGIYKYGVSNLDFAGNNVPVWCITLASDFSAWTVDRIQ